MISGWLEPLLDRIKRDPTTVVCPVIDVIDDNTFAYRYSKAYFTNVGGFDWGLQFNWHAIPERDRKNRTRAIDPVRYMILLSYHLCLDHPQWLADYFRFLKHILKNSAAMILDLIFGAEKIWRYLSRFGCAEER